MLVCYALMLANGVAVILSSITPDSSLRAAGLIDLVGDNTRI